MILGEPRDIGVGKGGAELAAMVVGAVVAVSDFELSRDSLVRYAGASGDFNPIHYRDDFARSVGLDGVIAHGMLTMGVAVQPVVNALAGVGRILDYRVRFTRQVRVPAEGSVVLGVIAKIAEQQPDEERCRIDLTVSVDGRTVLGKAQLLVDLS